MANDSSESKTEEATPRRLRDARRRGQVARSPELAGAMSLLCTLLCVTGMAPWAARRITDFDQAVQGSFGNLTLAKVQAMTSEGLGLMMQISSIPLGVAGGVYMLGLWLQTGPVFSLDLVKPQLDRINPVSGAKKVLAIRSLVQFALVLLKAGIISTAAFLVCRNVLGDAIRVAYADAGAALAVADKALMDLLLWCGGLFALIGLADLAYQRWQYLRDLRMSLSEVRREHKADQGDGKLKSRRSSFARETAPREQLAFMHMASLVVHDGSARAVALIYRPKDYPLPLYLVHGNSNFGSEILTMAHQHGIPTTDDARLLVALYPSARVGLPIPDTQRAAVLAHLQSFAS